MLLNQVQSWAYTIPYGVRDFSALQALPVDMMVAGDVGLSATQVSTLIHGGPTGSRLVFGYVNLAEFGTYQPEWNAAYDANHDGKPDAGAPDWLANAFGAYPDVYTANYQTHSWLKIVENQVDAAVAKGYSGIFLDVLSGWNEHAGAVSPTATCLHLGVKTPNPVWL